MTCRKIRDQLAVFLVGELPADAEAAVRVHIETCPACAERAGALERLLGEIRDTSVLTERDVPPGFRAELMSRTREPELAAAPRRSRRSAALRRVLGRDRELRRLLPPAWAGGLVAAAAAVLLAAYLIQAGPADRSVPPETRPRTAERFAAAGDEAEDQAPGSSAAPAAELAGAGLPLRPYAVGGKHREGALPAEASATRPPAEDAPAETAAAGARPPEIKKVAGESGAPARPRAGPDEHDYEYEREAVARLVAFKGSVRASRGRGGRSRFAVVSFPVHRGLGLGPDDRLDTRDGTASLEFRGGGVAYVNSSSVLCVSEVVSGNRTVPMVALRRGEAVIEDRGKSIHVGTRDALFSPSGTCYYVKAGVVVTVLVVAEGEVLARAKTEDGDLLGEAVLVTADRKCYVRAGRAPEKPTHVTAAEYIAWAIRLRQKAKTRYVAETFDRSSDLTTGLSAAMDICPGVFKVELRGGELVLGPPGPEGELGRPQGEWFGGMPFWTRESFVLSEGVALSCDMSGKVSGSPSPITALCLYEITSREDSPRPKIVLRLDLHGGTAGIVQGRTHKHDIRLGRYPASRAASRLDRGELLVDEREIVAVVNGRRFGPFAWSITPPERVRAGAEGNFQTGYRGEPVRFDNFRVRSGVKAGLRRTGRRQRPAVGTDEVVADHEVVAGHIERRQGGEE